MPGTEQGSVRGRPSYHAADAPGHGSGWALRGPGPVLVEVLPLLASAPSAASV